MEINGDINTIKGRAWSNTAKTIDGVNREENKKAPR